jgi:hypothetical protein
LSSTIESICWKTVGSFVRSDWTRTEKVDFSAKKINEKSAQKYLFLIVHGEDDHVLGELSGWEDILAVFQRN